MTLPRITVVTPCLNGARYIAESVESVRRQAYPDLEHIVLDAVSTDGTLEILQRYPDVKVVSMPDEGAHDAMNRGVRMASGEIVGFLNVDDLYPDDTLIEVGRLFASDPTLDIVVGNSIVFVDDASGAHTVVGNHAHTKMNGLWIPELTFGIPGINGCFFRRRVFDGIDKFRTDYPFSGDRLALITIVLAGMQSRRLGKPGICYRMHAGSRTIDPAMRNLMAISHECFRMARDLSNRASAHPAAKRIFQAWHAIEGIKLTLRHMNAGEFRKAAAVFATLTWQSPLWPIHFLHGLVLRKVVAASDRSTAEADPR